jgi:hypothetical protein
MKHLTLNELRHFDKINLLFKGDENGLGWLEYIIDWNTELFKQLLIIVCIESLRY